MGKQILTTIVWTVTLFVLIATFNSFRGVDDVLMKTLDWFFPAAIGFFLGYQVARDKNNI